MTWPPDYHMHTPLCLHAVGEPVEYAARAVKLGLTEIGFSDHSPMRQDNFDRWRMPLSDLDPYVEKVRRAQRDFPNLTIKLALEVDYFPDGEDWIRELAARHPWDYFIGSVHYVSGLFAIDDPKLLEKWQSSDVFGVWSDYFERLAKAAASGLFQIIGHADLPKKFNFRPKQDCRPLYGMFLDDAKKADVAIELNTAGLRKDCQEIYPCRELLVMAAERQVPITFGSDAHAPEEVGYAFADAMALARSVGYSHSCRFHAKKRTTAPF